MQCPAIRTCYSKRSEEKEEQEEEEEEQEEEEEEERVSRQREGRVAVWVVRVGMEGSVGRR